MSDKYSKPPRILQFLLKFISKPDERFSVVGDFEEIYNDLAEKDGKIAALHWYSWQILKSLPFDMVNSPPRYVVPNLFSLNNFVLGVYSNIDSSKILYFSKKTPIDSE